MLEFKAMGLGLLLQFKFASTEAKDATPKKQLKRIENWFAKQLPGDVTESAVVQDEQENPLLRIRLHPCAEDLFIKPVSKTTFEIELKTTTVGPGFHIFVCGALKQMGHDLELRWKKPESDGDSGDETGYFHGDGDERLYREMLAWLRAVGNSLSEYTDTSFQLNMTLDSNFLANDEPNGTIITPMGPRDSRWLNAIKKDPSKGFDIWPWYSKGKGAEYHLGMALCQMWTDVRWRAPLVDAETDLLKSVTEHLEHAHQLDSTLDYPWREWLEMLDILESKSPLRKVIKHHAKTLNDKPLIGYRRRNVQKTVGGGWTIRIPGAMILDSDEKGTFIAYDADRTVRVSSFSINPSPSTEQLLKDILEESAAKWHHQSDTVVGRATIERTREDNQQYWMLTGGMAQPGRLAFVTICFPNVKDRDWAVAVWKSLDHPVDEQ